MSLSPARPGLAIVALTLGGVAIGTSEFATMGVLPQLASGLDVSIPHAGQAISAYALGVVVGAPLVAIVAASWPRKGLLLGLVGMILAGNALTALAASFPALIAARVLAGVPHGAYFGVAALVAVALAPAGRGGRAVGRVMLGIPIANVAGVPTATWLGQRYGWQAAYLLVTVVAAAAGALLLAGLPRLPRPEGGGVRGELRDLIQPQVVLTLLVGAMGFGGAFAMISYIAPVLTEVTGVPASSVPIFLLVNGIGGIVGTWLAGRLADWSVLRALVIGSVGMALNLAAFALLARWVIPAAATIFASSIVAGLVVIGLQMRLMQVAGRAQTMAAAGNHAALNLANALGAWVGGVVIAAGYGYTAPSWAGVGLSLLGLVVLAVSVRLHLGRHHHAASSGPAPHSR